MINLGLNEHSNFVPKVNWYTMQLFSLNINKSERYSYKLISPLRCQQGFVKIFFWHLAIKNSNVTHIRISLKICVKLP
jgi:hypothetical protein